MVHELKEKLEFCLKLGNGPWIETYNCLGTLNSLEETVRRADLLRGWKANPVELVQKVEEQIQAFQEPLLEPYLMQLKLLHNYLEALIAYSLPQMSAPEHLPLPWEYPDVHQGFRTRAVKKLQHIKEFLLRRRRWEQESQDEIQELRNRR
jgi:hypothetical protein